MLNSKWLNMVLDVIFMALNIQIHDLFFKFLIFIMYLKASSQNFVENHPFNVILFYFKQISNNNLSNITYLHTICTVF